MAERIEGTSALGVVIADDDPDIRVLLRSLLHLEQRIDVIGEATNGEEALSMYAALHPDVLVLDERMPLLHGLEVAQRVLREFPEQVVILCTAYVDDQVKTDAAALGVRSVLGKDDIHRVGAEILRLAG